MIAVFGEERISGPLPNVREFPIARAR